MPHSVYEIQDNECTAHCQLSHMWQQLAAIIQKWQLTITSLLLSNSNSYSNPLTERITKGNDAFPV